MSDIPNIAKAASSQAAAELLPQVYDELRKLATAKLAAEQPGASSSKTLLDRTGTASCWPWMQRSSSWRWRSRITRS